MTKKRATVYINICICINAHALYVYVFFQTISAKAGSIGCLELLVNVDDIEIDVKNRLEGDTPLHKAVQHQDEDLPMAVAMVELLLEAGADPRYV